MKKFDLEKFKAGAVAVDKKGTEYHFIFQPSEDSLEVQFTRECDGWPINRFTTLRYAKQFWRMRELKYPCTCSSTKERLHCKENCDHVNQIQSVKPPPKWIVFREFDSKKEAEEYAEFFGLTKFIWKIEKR